MNLIEEHYNESETKKRTRKRIITSAIELFSQKGMDNITMNEVAELSEVTLRNLYRYYPSMEYLVVDAAYIRLGDAVSVISDIHEPGMVMEEIFRKYLMKSFSSLFHEADSKNLIKFTIYFDIYIEKMDPEHPAYKLYVEKYRDGLNNNIDTDLADMLIRGIKDGEFTIRMDQIDETVVFILQSLAAIMMRVIIKESENPTINGLLYEQQVEAIMAYLTKRRKT